MKKTPAYNELPGHGRFLESQTISLEIVSKRKTPVESRCKVQAKSSGSNWNEELVLATVQSDARPTDLQLKRVVGWEYEPPRNRWASCTSRQRYGHLITG